MTKLVFEAWEGGNTLHNEDNTIRAEVAVPPGASGDYGYLAMRDAILRAYTGPEALSFWYDGYEDALCPDAADGEPFVEIEPGV